MVLVPPTRGILVILQLWLLVINVHSENYKCSRQEVPCGCGYWPVSTTERIINGVDSLPYSWSMMVSIRPTDKMEHHCGGTILSDSHILTAATCVELEKSDAPSVLSITTGIYFFAEKNPTVRVADAIYIHPKWKSETGTLTDDIAIIHLKDPLNITLDSYIARTCVPRRDPSIEVTDQPRNGTKLLTVGWGWKSDPDGDTSEIMQQATIETFHHDDPSCAKSIYDPELQFCAGHQDNITGQSFVHFTSPYVEFDSFRIFQVHVQVRNVDLYFPSASRRSLLER